MFRRKHFILFILYYSFKIRINVSIQGPAASAGFVEETSSEYAYSCMYIRSMGNMDIFSKKIISRTTNYYII